MKCKGAVVTGASGGIGSQIVRELCGEGFHVVAGYKNDRASAEALCAEMREQGFLAEAFCADVSNPAQAVRLAEAAAARFGGIELLVNNAGVSLFALSQETTDEEYDLVFDTNMRGVFNMCRAVIPSMIRAECGSIVNISSVWGVCGASCESVYSASKAAVIGYTKALAKELGSSGITVNCIAPGVIDTKMNGALGAQELKNLAAETPLSRLGTPREVASLVGYLALDRFITGQIIGVDGGFGL